MPCNYSQTRQLAAELDAQTEVRPRLPGSGTAEIENDVDKRDLIGL